MKNQLVCLLLLLITLISCQSKVEQENSTIKSSDYNDLVALFREWRNFEKPPQKNGAPDYTAATFDARWPEFKKLQTKLLAIDYSQWPVEQQVDWRIV